MKKIICYIFKHKVVTESCPVTKVKIDYCSRCNLGKSSTHSRVSFN